MEAEGSHAILAQRSRAGNGEESRYDPQFSWPTVENRRKAKNYISNKPRITPLLNPQ